MTGRGEQLDPWELLRVLQEHRAMYVVVGAFARVLHGAPEQTSGIDIVPWPRAENLRHLDAALVELRAERDDGRYLEPLASAYPPAEPVIRLRTDFGRLSIVAEPRGTSGFDDLRRRSEIENIGHGVRIQVASASDCLRMLAALERPEDADRLRLLQRTVELSSLQREQTRQARQAELERRRGHERDSGLGPEL